MKITKAKIKRELMEKYGWGENLLNIPFSNELIDNTMSIINDILIKEKGIKIK